MCARVLFGTNLLHSKVRCSIVTLVIPSTKFIYTLVGFQLYIAKIPGANNHPHRARPVKIHSASQDMMSPLKVLLLAAVKVNSTLI